jgi:hypothetical protein
MRASPLQELAQCLKLALLKQCPFVSIFQFMDAAAKLGVQSWPDRDARRLALGGECYRIMDSHFYNSSLWNG